MHKLATGVAKGHRSRLATMVVATSISLAAGAKETQPLNSDKIRERFGHYGVELLHQDAIARLASLYSMSDQRRITRTLALTRFELPTHPALAVEDEQIRAGASIGATLRSAGWQVIKDGQADCQTLAGERFARLGGSTLAADDPVLIRVYTLKVTGKNLSLDYAVIAEAYHPEHIPPTAELPCTRTIEDTLSTSQSLALSGLLSAMNQGDSPS